MSGHKFKPERTNGGAYFCDCSCGWQGGVWPSRSAASAAHAVHAAGGEPDGKLTPVVILNHRSWEPQHD